MMLLPGTTIGTSLLKYHVCFIPSFRAVIRAAGHTEWQTGFAAFPCFFVQLSTLPL